MSRREILALCGEIKVILSHHTPLAFSVKKLLSRFPPLSMIGIDSLRSQVNADLQIPRDILRFDGNKHAV